MIISAYEKRGEAKLFSVEEQLRGFYRTPLETYSPSRSVTPETPVTVMQPVIEIPDRPSARAVRMVGRFLVRKVGIRVIPIVGWAILAKDIYDVATN